MPKWSASIHQSHKAKFLSCIDCNNIFYCQTELRRHAMIHNVEEPLESTIPTLQVQEPLESTVSNLQVQGN